MRFKDDIQKFLYYDSQIGYCYWRLSEMQNQLNKPVTPVNALIDAITGYANELGKEHLKEAKFLVKTIIRCKTKMDYETDNDVKFLETLKAISCYK